MLNKFLLISLGGSGEKLARYLKQDLEQRLYNEGWERGIPRAFRWVCFDVARNSDVVVKDVPADLGKRNGSRIGLADDELRYNHYLHQVTTNPAALPALVGALPKPTVELPPPVKGAGQRPQVGNVVGLASLRQMKTAIEQQMVALNGDGVVDELEELSDRLRTGAEDKQPGTTVLIASSLGGGSGAGLLQLVTEMVLNTVGNNPEVEIATALFTPDVFYDLTDTEKQGVQANSLYTVSALLNGYYGAGERPAALASLLGTGGVELSARRRAVATNFFLGRSNGAFDFLHQNVAIKAVAKALGRLLLDEETLKSFESHLKTNGEGASVTDDFRVVPPSSQDLSRAASSFGYASLSLGEAQLAEYASERLAKIQLEAFLRGHRRQRSPEESDDATVERLVTEELPWFLERAKLREEDVLGSLYDREELRREAKARAKEVEESIREIPRADAPKQWLGHVERSFREHETALAEKHGEDPEKAPERVCDEIQAAVCAATVESVGRHGARVAAALLEAAGGHVSGAAFELRRRRDEEQEKQAEVYAQRSKGVLTSVEEKEIPHTHEALAKSVEARGAAAFLVEDSAYLKEAAELLGGFPEKVLEPLRACVEKARSEVEGAATGHHAELVESWSDKAVPPRMEPAPNQVLLEPIEGFPALFEELLEKTLDEAILDAEEKAAAELLTGSWSESDREPMILLKRKWRHGSRTPATFGFSLRIPDLKTRSDAWVRNRPGALADRLKLSIADWIGQESGGEQAFAEGFERALRRADPLAEISSGVHLRVHGAPRSPSKLHVSTIPVSADSNVGQTLASSLDGRVAPGELEGLFDATSSTTMIEFSSFFAQQVEPVVLKGLFGPIGEDWSTRVDDSMRRQFSAFRRTRSLPLFAPLSPTDQRRFFSGWIVAELLEYLSPFGESWDQAPLSVWSPDGELRFPAHLLGGDVTEAEEVPARVFESLPLALVRCAAEQFEELEAYMRILDLGDLDELGSWGEDGEVRRRQLLEQVERRLLENASYRRDHQVDQGNVTELGPRWEVAELTEEALERVKKALVDFDLPHTDGDAPAALVP